MLLWILGIALVVLLFLGVIGPHGVGLGVVIGVPLCFLIMWGLGKGSAVITKMSRRN